MVVGLGLLLGLPKRYYIGGSRSGIVKGFGCLGGFWLFRVVEGSGFGRV